MIRCVGRGGSLRRSWRACLVTPGASGTARPCCEKRPPDGSSQPSRTWMQATVCLARREEARRRTPNRRLAFVLPPDLAGRRLRREVGRVRRERQPATDGRPRRLALLRGDLCRFGQHVCEVFVDDGFDGSVQAWWHVYVSAARRQRGSNARFARLCAREK
ncbi:hypothetical protein T492DRAFT_1107368 [Pavlovales sp. CCMP2436]|nr:hypothetical protein T492DRAFT_1107368 [Pavlovales sp. CCMP2436]